MSKTIDIERHPWPPFLPKDCKVMMLGTFPPKPQRWSMDFFYPNKINDMWRIMGIIFYNDKNHFWDAAGQRFRLNDIKAFLKEKRIGLWDTAMAVRRLKDNASDRFLDIVEAIDLERLLNEHPTISAIVTTGEKATSVIAVQGGVEVPRIGIPTPCICGAHEFTLWRMPSSSRAYPLALDKKATAYAAMFQSTLQEPLKSDKRNA